ncbi:hypothetical protein Taro_000020, partial [Colocasia esculenta]|nr:hypothetical protein [Colocasia esculenta]
LPGIWYNTISQQTIIWVANWDWGINNSTGVLSFYNNGSLVLSHARGEVYWSTGAAAGVTSPVARVLDSTNFVVTGSGGGAPTWQSFDYPTDSLLSAMKLGGNAAVEEGAMDRAAFSGIPEMKTYDMFAFRFHNSTDEEYYQFDILNNTVLSRLGLVERMVWIEGTKSWNRFWFAPKDQCDSVSPCGPFSICNTNDSPICSCVQGFKPQSP